MITKRKIGTLGALGGLTAAVALLTGLSTARADELADLRANQELLQQRIDQLAQATNAPLAAPGAPYPGGPPNPAMTTGATGGSFPRSFLIPGTDTSIRIGGEIREVLDYYLTGAPVNQSPQGGTTVGNTGQADAMALDVHGQFVPGTPPPGAPGLGPFVPGAGNVPVQVAHSRGNGFFLQSPAESKINFETRTPSPYGEVRTFVEFDFAGSNANVPDGGHPLGVSDSLVPRLRYAYGTFGGFLAGQANSNFADSDANAETLDFGGQAGTPGIVRVPQVRYTVPINWGWGGAFSVSAETPETDVATPVGFIGSDAGTVPAGLTVNPAINTAPDLTFAYYVPQPWGHLDLSLVVRPDLEIQDGKFVDRTYQGYGGHIGFDVKPGWFGWAKDDITFQFEAGDGMGRYLNCGCTPGLVTNFVVSPTSAVAARSVVAETIPSFGVAAGYQHFWADNLRSTAAFGLLHQDVNSTLLGPSQDTVINKEVITGHVNLIWTPVAFVDFGVEYVYAHRDVVANIKGDMNTVIGEFRVRF